MSLMWRRGSAAAAAFRLPNPLLRNFEARSIVLPWGGGGEEGYLPGTRRRGNYGRYDDAIRSVRARARARCRYNSGEVVTAVRKLRLCEFARLRLSALSLEVETSIDYL